jgi:hypothetical protein
MATTLADGAPRLRMLPIRALSSHAGFHANEGDRFSTLRTRDNRATLWPNPRLCCKALLKKTVGSEAAAAGAQRELLGPTAAERFFKARKDLQALARR